MKFAREDARYFAQRKQVSEEFGPRELWSTIDHWPLYCGIGNLARFLAISDIFRSTQDVPGHVAEFGSWRGANLLFLAKMLRIYDPLGSKMVHCFDSFEGLTAFEPEDGIAQTQAGDYKGDLAELRKMIDLYELQDDIEIHIGLVEDTLPKVVAENEGLSFSFIYCDTDLYASTAAILQNLHSRLSIGGVFVLDEWNHEKMPGETVAVREFLEANPHKYRMEHVQNARQPTLVLRRLDQ